MRQVGELMLILFCLVADLADADLVPETTSNASRPVPRYVTWFLGLYCFKQVTMVTFKVFPRVVKWLLVMRRASSGCIVSSKLRVTMVTSECKVVRCLMPTLSPGNNWNWKWCCALQPSWIKIFQQAMHSTFSSGYHMITSVSKNVLLLAEIRFATHGILVSFIQWHKGLCLILTHSTLLPHTLRIALYILFPISCTLIHEQMCTCNL